MTMPCESGPLGPQEETTSAQPSNRDGIRRLRRWILVPSALVFLLWPWVRQYEVAHLLGRTSLACLILAYWAPAAPRRWILTPIAGLFVLWRWVGEYAIAGVALKLSVAYLICALLGPTAEFFRDLLEDFEEESERLVEERRGRETGAAILVGLRLIALLVVAYAFLDPVLYDEESLDLSSWELFLYPPVAMSVANYAGWSARFTRSIRYAIWLGLYVFSAMLIVQALSPELMTDKVFRSVCWVGSTLAIGGACLIVLGHIWRIVREIRSR